MRLCAGKCHIDAQSAVTFVQPLVSMQAAVAHIPCAQLNRLAVLSSASPARRCRSPLACRGLPDDEAAEPGNCSYNVTLLACMFTMFSNASIQA